LTDIALKLEKVFAAKVIAAFKAGEPSMTKEQIGAGVHGDLALAYISEYVIAVCEALDHKEGKQQGVVTAMVLDRALHYPKDDILPAILNIRSRVVAAIEAMSKVEGASADVLPPETQIMLSVAWSGKQNGERYAADLLNGSEELTGQEVVEFSAIVLGKIQPPKGETG
jgi:hypothetical protein